MQSRTLYIKKFKMANWQCSNRSRGLLLEVYGILDHYNLLSLRDKIIVVIKPIVLLLLRLLLSLLLL